MVTTGAEPSNRKDGFPIGMQVLAVDDDRVCLKLLETMLLDCGYKVTATQHALNALKLLRENKDYYDLVISDVQMPDMDGFKLLEIIGLEMDLPVIMLSVNSDVNTVMRGILHGACDYLVKPVRLEELRTIWKHVVRKSLHDAKEANDSSDRDVTKVEIDNTLNIARKCKDQRKVREDEADENLDEDLSKQKKPRVIWSSELHMKFIKAVNQIGLDRAVPKRILELMNVQGITRENVASHLQKYRKAMKKNGNAMRQYYLGVLGFKDFGVSTPGSSLMSFNHQVCSKVNSLGGHNSNEYQLHRGIIPFSQPQNSHNSIAPVTPLYSFSFSHQDSLSQHVASSAPQIGQLTVQQPGYSSDFDGTINIQSGFNGLGYEQFVSQANQAAGFTDNISQNQWAGSANHGHASVQLPGCHSNLNSTDITFDKISSQNGGWINSASCQRNVLIPDLGTGGQTSEDVLNEKHFESTNHAGLIELSSREAMFHPNNCDSEDDLHTVIKQVLPLRGVHYFWPSSNNRSRGSYWTSNHGDGY